jgi:hypothetical protein
MSQSADSKLNTEYWKLVCEVHFVKTRDPLYKMEECSCQSPFMFAYDAHDRCSDCNGSGWKRVNLPYPERPQIPQELLDHLSKAYKEWNDEKLGL